jgi:hypothetical protein
MGIARITASLLTLTLDECVVRVGLSIHAVSLTNTGGGCDLQLRFGSGSEKLEISGAL